MIKELLEKQKHYIDYFFSHVDAEQMTKVFEIVRHCQGLLFFSGIGKSGIVAEKVSVTMTSTGTRALFLSPNNALHGDIGIVKEGDIFIFLSKSGESDELLQLLPFLRNRGIMIIGVTSNPESRLHKSCDLSLHLPLMQELCPFGMAPTTSTTIQCIFGDILTVAMMADKEFTLAEYALNHPSGRIGKRITLKVKDLMLKDDQIPLCSPQDKLIDVLVNFSDKKCGCMLVTDPHHQLLGIFTDGDLRRSLQDKGADVLQLPMNVLMKTEPKTILADYMAYEAMKIMESNHHSPIMVLPVVDESRKVQGLIKMHDLVQSGL